ncbi:hypothetical protein [Streptomyces sp. NPDC059175]|uniref:hypothetical protein n=1 Tax=unclassified Streptomyces TaxID=2593676 RepID=UPI00369C1F83
MRSDLLNVALPLVTFQRSCPFPPSILPDDEAVTSVPTLRSYERDEIEASPNTAGSEVDEVWDVADRTGPERVFAARRP